jgi:hypothetical protein
MQAGEALVAIASASKFAIPATSSGKTTTT